MGVNKLEISQVTINARNIAIQRSPWSEVLSPSQKVKVDLAPFHEAIRACALEAPHKMTSIFADFRQRRLEPGAVAYRAAVTGLMDQGLTSQAIRFQ